MNVEEIGRLLAKVAGYDNRTVGDANILAWHEALSDVDYRDALEAVATHFREATDYLMPVHIRRGTAAIDHNRRRGRREQAEAQQAIEGSRKFTTADVQRGAAVLAGLREKLPPGAPGKLRGEHWLATNGRGQLRDGTRLAKPPTTPNVPNPYFDLAAVRQLAALNAAESDDAPAPE